jgi:hypothetical protein
MVSPKSLYTPKANPAKVTSTIWRSKITATIIRKSGLRVKPSKMFFYVRKHKYLLMKFTAVEEVEDLHHDKGVEDKGEVPRVEVEFILDGLIVNIPVNEVETT